MCKLLSGIFLIFCCAAFAAAQSDDSPRTEFFAGYSVLETKYEAERPNPPQPVITFFDGKQTLNGFNVSATGYLNKRFGLTGDFSAHFKTNKIADPLGGNIETNVRVFNILGGPQYKFRNSNRATPFVRALAIGGGLDVRVNKRVDLRVFQADYNPIF